MVGEGADLRLSPLEIEASRDLGDFDRLVSW